MGSQIYQVELENYRILIKCNAYFFLNIPVFKVLFDHICISALDLNITNSKLFDYASYSLLMT